MSSQIKIARLGTYLLNEKSVSYQERLYQSIILTLVHNRNQPIEVHEIKSEIIKLLGVEPNSSHLNKAAAVLLKANRLRFENERFILPKDVQYSLDKLIGEHLKREEEVINVYSEKVDKDFSKGKKEFYEKISSIFSEIGARGLQSILNAPISPYHNIDNDFLRLIKEIISENKDFVEFFYSLATSYAAVNVLNLDPDCIKLSQNILKKKIIYLDTNMLLSYIGEDTKGIRELIKLLGAERNDRIRVFSPTVEEYRNLLNNWKEYVSGEEFSENRLLRYEKVIDGDILKFWKNTQSLTPMPLSQYLAMISRIDIYLEKLGIQVDSELGDIENWTELENIQKTIKLESMRKNDNTSYHDAYALLRIQELRNQDPSDLAGPQYWFLTRDHSLKRVEIHHDFQIPSSIHLEELIPILSIFYSSDSIYESGKEVFYNLMTSTLVPITKTIKIDDYLALEGSWMDDSVLDSQDMARIFGEDRVINLIKSAKKSGNIIAKEDLEYALKPILAELHKTREEDTAEIEDLKKVVYESNDQLRQMENYQKKQDEKIKQIASELLETKESKKVLDEKFDSRENLYHFILGVLAIGSSIIALIVSFLLTNNLFVTFTSVGAISGIIILFSVYIFGYEPKKAYNYLKTLKK